MYVEKTTAFENTYAYTATSHLIIDFLIMLLKIVYATHCFSAKYRKISIEIKCRPLLFQLQLNITIKVVRVFNFLRLYKAFFCKGNPRSGFPNSLNKLKTY